MKNAQGTGGILVMLLVLGLTASTSRAEELSARDLRKLEKQAAKADAAGQHDAAKELYESILDGTEPGDSRRADGLFFVVVKELANGDGLSSGGRAHLDELLSSFPHHARRDQIELFDDWLRRDVAQREEIARLEQSLAEQAAACEAMKGELSGAAGEQQEEMAGKIRRLERQLATVRQDLAATQAELETKEEALEKLKNALVGGGR